MKPEDPPPQKGVSPAEVVDLASVRARRQEPKPGAAKPRRTGWLVWTAGGIGLVALLVAAQMAWTYRQPMIGLRGGSLIAHGRLAMALDSQPASRPAEGQAVRVVVTFRDADGRYCRAFMTAEHAGVACRDARDWMIRMLIDPPFGSQYRVASSQLPPPVTTAITETIAGEPFDAEAESRARAAGWK